MEEPIGLKTATEVFQTAEIALDGYDDIFSDFDPSPYETRLLSEDFIIELRRRHAAKDKGSFVVKLTLPGSLRSDKTESLIKKRIRDHFRFRYRELEVSRKEKIRHGAFLLLLGIALSASLIFIPLLETVPFLTIFSVLIWYTMWSGFEKLLEPSRRLGKKISFAERFMKAEYAFISQEDLVSSLQKIGPSDKFA
ncbi:MAG: hypothetical protein V1827_04345 [Candidatus Micrarchaeota archaeon]